MPPLFKSLDERKLAVVAGAAVAMHAMVCSDSLKGGDQLVSAAFDVAEAFIAEAERRLAQP